MVLNEDIRKHGQLAKEGMAAIASPTTYIPTAWPPSTCSTPGRGAM
jgi:hypothetical protein